MRLTAAEGRVLGALVEKELTTPQAYPLTDNALLAACNQTTSRDPVVSYDTAVLRPAVRSLRDQGLLRTVHRTGERSDKHQHELATALDLTPAAVALLGLLLLRGPQTAAELRARAERWHPFADAAEVEDALAGLAARDEPLVARLERQPGRKEGRYAQLLVQEVGRPDAGSGVATRAAPSVTVAPQEPMAPLDSAPPSVPAAPREPAAPSAPAALREPAAPSAPIAPSVPAAPLHPATPSVPAAPVPAHDRAAATLADERTLVADLAGEVAALRAEVGTLRAQVRALETHVDALLPE